MVDLLRVFSPDPTTNCRRWSARTLLSAAVLGAALTGPLEAGDSDIDVSVGDNARAATGPAGDSVVVFESDDADDDGVFAGRYDTNGALVGQLFQVNVTTLGDQSEPDVVWLESGDFIVVWRTDALKGATIQKRRFAADGSPLSGEVQVGAATLDPESPRIAADALSRYTVAWADAGGLMQQRFDSAGMTLGAEQTVTLAEVEDPTLAVDGGGDWLVAWAEGVDVRGRRFAADGTALGVDFPVPPPTLGERSDPDASPSGDGAFLVSYESEGQDGSGSGIFVRRVEDVPVGEEFPINSFTTGDQSQPSLGLTDEGQILVTWQSEVNSVGESAEILGRFLRPTGRPVCPDATINRQTALAQRVPAVAGGGGRFFVTWQTEAPVPMPGQTASVKARFIVPPLFADGFESGDFSAWSAVVP